MLYAICYMLNKIKKLKTNKIIIYLLIDHPVKPVRLNCWSVYLLHHNIYRYCDEESNTLIRILSTRDLELLIVRTSDLLFRSAFLLLLLLFSLSGGNELQTDWRGLPVKSFWTLLSNLIKNSVNVPEVIKHVSSSSLLLNTSCFCLSVCLQVKLIWQEAAGLLSLSLQSSSWGGALWGGLSRLSAESVC